LYITDAATERVFVRTMTLDQGLDTVAVEGLSFVAQGSLEALLAGNPIGMTRDAFQHSLDGATPGTGVRESAPVAPAAAMPPDRQSHWHVSAGYEPQWWNRSIVRHAVNLGLAYERGSLRYGVDLFGTWPIQIDSGDAGASLFSGGVRLDLSRPLAVSKHVSLVPGLGFAVEVTRIRPELGGPNAQAATTSFALDPTARAHVGIERSFGRWSLRGIVGADFALRPVHYVVIGPNGTEIVATPWRERPFAAVVVSAPL
jgi:hypothetical protein